MNYIESLMEQATLQNSVCAAIAAIVFTLLYIYVPHVRYMVSWVLCRYRKEIDAFIDEQIIAQHLGPIKGILRVELKDELLKSIIFNGIDISSDMAKEEITRLLDMLRHGRIKT